MLPKPPQPPLRQKRQQGVALIIVLAMILLMSALVVGLLSTAENEARTTALLAHAIEARLGVNAALTIAQGHLKTAAQSGIDDEGRGTHIWASQPGALRIYNQEGEEISFLKLYSSDRMVLPNGDFLDAATNPDLPDDWRDLPDEFTDLNEPVHRNGNWIYPVASPEALGIVEGFSSTLSANPTPTAPWDDRLIMPVRWLYMDDEGTITTDPTQGNPIIRFAFWTDDESTKINVNTASAGNTDSGWDIPRAAFLTERNLLSYRQPSQNEFNRYPGHPAMVNLQTVFPDVSIQNLINTSPRYQWGGSENGAVQIPPLGNRVEINNASKQNRLYATIDEYLYSPLRATQLGLTPATLDTRRFFLTTSSRSSELNLFGQPRVTLWPVHAVNTPQRRTPYDQLISFNSTISGHHRYHFVRSNALSQTEDWVAHPRNQALFTYLQAMTSRDIPGFGGNFLEKYDSLNGGVTGERDQILTAMFDYIRCINLNETWPNRPTDFTSYTTDVTTYEAVDADVAARKGLAWVLPIEISTLGTRGAGRVPIIAEVGIWLIQTKDYAYIPPVPPEEEGTHNHTNPTTPEVQPGLIIDTFSPMQGMAPWTPNEFSVEVRNITAPAINGTPLFPNGETPLINHPPGSARPRSQSIGGTDGYAWIREANGNTFDAYRFYTKKPDAIKITTPHASITAGEIEITFKCSGVPFQTTRISIPAANVPIPIPADIAPSTVETRNQNSGWATRKMVGTLPALFFEEDTIRSVVHRDGDFRTTAYLQNVPSVFFIPQDGYTDTARRKVHGVRHYFHIAHAHAENGSYISGLTYAKHAHSNPLLTYSGHPKIQPLITDLRSQQWEGDFDNGIAGSIDGPFLNKTDEGARRYQNNAAANLNTYPPYFFDRWTNADGFFSPVRQIPSAVMFGSIPTGVKRTTLAYNNSQPANAKPWRTLNFCPLPLAGTAHYGLTDPPDWLIADLFTMPMVEPLALSEPFSTAGRINLNHRIAPFNYIERTTALRAALSTQHLIAIPDSLSATYKAPVTTASNSIRHPLNIDETLTAMEEYLSDQGQSLFRSAAEICGVPLIPATGNPAVTASTIASWWDTHRLTGNNSRERPYASLHPLLTTRSNTYQMHVRVQAIQRGKSSGRIIVQGEYRGSLLFERYLDPHDHRFAPSEGNSTPEIDPDALSLEPYFRFRTLLSKQFDP